MLSKTFEGAEFEGCNQAEAWLRDRGFSAGSMQRGDPRGILFGDYVIAKWRNLYASQKEAMHGTMTGAMRDGPVMITLRSEAPAEAVEAWKRA